MNEKKTLSQRTERIREIDKQITTLFDELQAL